MAYLYYSKRILISFREIIYLSYYISIRKVVSGTIL